MNAPQLLHVPTTGETGPKLREYHPRQWVDSSGPAYKRRPLACFSNPTHGSGWIVQVQPTNEGRSPASRIPPTGVGGSFKSSLQTKAARLLLESHPREWVDRSSPAYKRRPLACFSNPTHGSGWIVQVQPTDEGRSRASRIPPTR